SGTGGSGEARRSQQRPSAMKWKTAPSSGGNSSPQGSDSSLTQYAAPREPEILQYLAQRVRSELTLTGGRMAKDFHQPIMESTPRPSHISRSNWGRRSAEREDRLHCHGKHGAGCRVGRGREPLTK